jgi:hypothetical protein
MADTTAPVPSGEDRRRPTRRDPISVKWHHSVFEISLVSVQAVTAAITMMVAIVGALYVHGEHEDRRQARMTRAWTLLNETQEDGLHNFGQVEALQSLHGDGANLREIDMSARYLQGVILQGANLYASDFSGSKLMAADLRRTDLRHARFESAKLKGARFDGADLERADLGGADLAGAILRRAHLTGVNFNGLNLSGADLRGARGLTQTMLAKACVSPGQPALLPVEFQSPPYC